MPRHIPHELPRHCAPAHPLCACLPSHCSPCSLELLRLDKSFWLMRSQRWTPASLRALERLQQRRPDLTVEGLESHQRAW